MPSAITSADANRQFSKLLRRVRDGQTVTITSHGRPVARMVPVAETESGRIAARAELVARLDRARRRSIGAWSRGELYEDPSVAPRRRLEPRR